MKEKFHNRRKRRQKIIASDRYEYLEKLVTEVQVELDETLENLHISKDGVEASKEMLEVKHFKQLIKEISEINEEIETLADNYQRVLKLFEKLERTKNDDAIANSSYHNKFMRRTNSLIDQLELIYDEVYDLSEDIDSILETIGVDLEDEVEEKSKYESIHDVTDIINKAYSKIKDSITPYFEPKDDKTSKIVNLMPFLDEKEKTEIVQMILKDDESVKGVKLVAIFPFLSKAECDSIFKAKMTELKKEEMTAIVPFVSKQVLSTAVDKYIAGELKIDKMDKLYPFLTQEDIKKLFFYEIKKTTDYEHVPVK